MFEGVFEEEGEAIELGMKNNTVHNPLSRFAFASIFQSAMNLKSLNVLPSVLPLEEEKEILIESHSCPMLMRYGSMPKCYGRIEQCHM